MKTGIHIEGGKATALNLKALAILGVALSEAIATGRETAACEIAREVGKVGGVNGTTITNCHLQG